MMLKVSKVAVAVGLVCPFLATVMVGFGLALDDVDLVFGAAAVGGLGLTAFGLGVAVVLRWQKRILTRIAKALGLPSDYSVDDLGDFEILGEFGEVIRVVDSRIVGFIEAVQDEMDRSAQ